MSRADLLALTPEAIASLSNMGLVKRAQREIAAGEGPSLEEEADGTVVGTFGEGVVARLVPGRTLKESPCTCGAQATCRHRVAVALAYPAWHAAAAHAAPEAPAAPAEPWSPAEIDDAAVRRALGDKLFARAEATRAAGLVATVDARLPPTAKLPSSTVRFLVPREIAYARCDCAEQGACEHLALAVWAFRAAKGGALRAEPEVVSLGGALAVDAEVLAEARALGGALVAGGVANAPVTQARFARARSGAERAGMVWVASLLSDLEAALEAYRARSALYSQAETRLLLLELEARCRAALAPSAELPARYVLGEDVAAETLLDHVRLMSLGVRLRADGETRIADVFLADPDTSEVVVLSRRWASSSEDGPALARRAVAAKIPLGVLATGQLVSKVVKRRANRAVEIGTTRAAQTAVTPGSGAGAWASLRAPVRVTDLAAHEVTLRTRAPAMLRPRLLAEDTHVVEVSRVTDVAYVPSEQAVVASLWGADGGHAQAVVRHRAVAPNAVDAAAAALAQRDVRYVSGELTAGPMGLELEVLGIAGATMVVPDLAGATPSPAGLPRALLARPGGALETAHLRATGVLEELLQVGVGAASEAVVARARSVVSALDDAGLAASARRLARVVSAAAARDGAAGAVAWTDAALRLALLELA